MKKFLFFLRTPELVHWSHLTTSPTSTRISHSRCSLCALSERRDRGPGMDVKPRWATIMRPARSMLHLVGRADSKLLSETRMGSVRRHCRRGRVLGGAPSPERLGWTSGGVHRRAIQQRGGQQRKWQWGRAIGGESDRYLINAAGSQWAGPARCLGQLCWERGGTQQRCRALRAQPCLR